MLVDLERTLLKFSDKKCWDVSNLFPLVSQQPQSLKPVRSLKDSGETLGVIYDDQRVNSFGLFYGLCQLLGSTEAICCDKTPLVKIC